MIDDHTPQTMAMQQLQGSGAGQMSAETQAALNWAVGRWTAEVKLRPLQNVHRRTLDDTWRQVIRYHGGDDRALIGPSHDELLDMPAQPLTTDTIDLTNPLPGDPPIQQQPNDAVFRGFRGNNEA
jgi:hypothetical protein